MGLELPASSLAPVDPLSRGTTTADARHWLLRRITRPRAAAPPAPARPALTRAVHSRAALIRAARFRTGLPKPNRPRPDLPKAIASVRRPMPDTQHAAATRQVMQHAATGPIHHSSVTQMSAAARVRADRLMRVRTVPPTARTARHMAAVVRFSAAQTRRTPCTKVMARMRAADNRTQGVQPPQMCVAAQPMADAPALAAMRSTAAARLTADAPAQAGMRSTAAAGLLMPDAPVVAVRRRT